MEHSKTEQALKDIEAGLTAAQAARKHEISESVVYRALRKKLAQVSGRCAHCGAPVDASGHYVPRTGD